MQKLCMNSSTNNRACRLYISDKEKPFYYDDAYVSVAQKKSYSMSCIGCEAVVEKSFIT